MTTHARREPRMRPNRKPTRERASAREIAPRPVRAIAAETAADLRKAIERFKRWGVDVPSNSRLNQALSVLENAASSGELVPKHRADDLGLRALELALDSRNIADSLPPERVASVRKELDRFVLGELDPPESDRGPLQFQSQFVVRAALHRAGISPATPTHSPKVGISSPDLVIENGTMRYGVEVKRPQFRKNVIPRFDDGVAQLADYGVRGAVIIDATDCLRDLPAPEFDHELREITLDLYERCWVNGQGFRPAYGHLMIAGVIGRVAWTSTDGEASSVINIHSCSNIGLLAMREFSLWDHHARWIRTKLQDGLGLLGFTSNEDASSHNLETG